MPIPALKTNEFIRKVNSSRENKKPLGDFDRHAITLHIRNLMTSDPVHALTLRGMLAYLDENFSGAKSDMEQAANLAPKYLPVICNLALVLADSGYDDSALDAVHKGLQLSLEQNDWTNINVLLGLAIRLGDMDTLADIIHSANKLGLCNDNLTQAALLLSVQSVSDEKALEELDTAMSESYLRAQSVKISDERWDEMGRLADELSQYVDQ